MSTYLYDEAIVAMFKSIVQDDRIYITPAENVFRTIGRLDDDNIRFPMISLTRTGQSLLPSQFSMRFSGASISYDPSTEVFKQLQAMPIKIDYLVDVWTKTREESDNIVRELVYYISTHPTLQVEIPYNSQFYVHNFNIFVNPNIEDNSDIIDHKNRGEYFRQTLSIYTDDAYFWKTSSQKRVQIDEIDLVPTNAPEAESIYKIYRENFVVDATKSEDPWENGFELKHRPRDMVEVLLHFTNSAGEKETRFYTEDMFECVPNPNDPSKAIIYLNTRPQDKCIYYLKVSYDDWREEIYNNEQ